MYIYTYIRNKNCHQYSYGFQNFMSSWGSWSKISKLQQVGDFSFFGYKSSFLVSKISFNYVYLMGRVDGLDGLDGPEKCPLNFFILCGYIDYVYIYLYTK